MRALVVILASLFVAPVALARGVKPTSTTHRAKATNATHRTQIAVREDDAPRRHKRDATPQSVGASWAGRLQHPSQLKLGDAAHIRRPYRAFGTRTTVEFTRRAIQETAKQFPKAHPLAIGDLSAQNGGPISDHHSHQSGRDVDIGLYYRKQPQGYPSGFVTGTEANLDRAAMWTLVSKLANTASKDGGVQIIFLDYDVQGILYRWAKDHGVSDQKLERIFQYPHGRDAGAGIIRHYRNHANHVHVRFKCSSADTGCR